MNKKPHKKAQEQNGVSERVLEAIDKKNIVPTPRWQFLLKRSVVWGAGVLSVGIGALAVAAALFSLVHSGWRYYAATHPSLFSFLLTTLPYVWIVVLIVFSGIAYYNIRHTEGGYRYPLSAIIAFSVLGSVLGGVLLYTLGFGNIIDRNAVRIAPFYRPTIEMQETLWEQPEEGRLAGEVVAFSAEDQELTLRTFAGEEWQIQTTDLREFDLSVLEDFESVRVVGVPTSSPNTLHACFVFPWEEFDRPLPPWEGDRPLPRMPGVRPGETPRFFERNSDAERSNECKDVPPYQKLLQLQRSN